MKNKGHLKGWQWRESERALGKKERAKARHFGDGTQRVEETEIFSSRERLSGDWGIVSTVEGKRIIVYYQDKYRSTQFQRRNKIRVNPEIAVGDHVGLTKEGNQYFVAELFERRTVLSRLRRDSTRRGSVLEVDEHVIAANVDVAVIVASAKNPPLHPKLIDRYLILVQHGGIEPVICLNKIDLADEHQHVEALYRPLNIPIVATSTATGEGIEELKEVLRGRTAVFVGHSGVGKSSLLNIIDPSAELDVGAVSSKSGKGRHTTTTSSLRVWDANSFIIDTPGVRSIGMWDIERTDLQLYFREFSSFASQCKYTDCLHDREDEASCGVKAAVHDGLIPLPRYESYLKILHEL